MPENAPRVMPSSIDAEKSVLGAMLLSEDCVLVAVEKLKEEDFYSRDNRRIFAAMLELTGRNLPVDYVTVSEKMSNGEPLSADEITYLSELSEAVPSLSNIDYYINIIKEKSRLRKLITTAAEIAEMGYKQDYPSADILDQASSSIYRISEEGEDRSLTQIRQALLEGYNSISNAAKSKDGLMGVATGFPMMDRMLSGFQPSQLIILAGRPGMGKTSFALNVGEHIAVVERKPVCLFSLEMSREQLGLRLLYSSSGVNSQNARNGKLSTDDFFALADAMVPLQDAPIYIDDSSVIGPTEIIAKVRRLKNQVGEIGLVIIDYLQLMSTNIRSENRQQEISSITRSLKVASKELGVPIMLLSQLSRASEKRQDKKPILSDLRESGSIEQDADVVIFLHREDYYEDGEDRKPSNKSSIIIAKQRSGPTGTIDVVWRGDKTKYMEVDFREGGEE